MCELSCSARANNKERPGAGSHRPWRLIRTATQQRVDGSSRVHLGSNRSNHAPTCTIHVSVLIQSPFRDTASRTRRAPEWGLSTACRSPASHDFSAHPKSAKRSSLCCATISSRRCGGPHHDPMQTSHHFTKRNCRGDAVRQSLPATPARLGGATADSSPYIHRKAEFATNSAWKPEIQHQ